MTKPKRGLATGRIVLGSLAVAISLVSTYFFGDLIQQDSEEIGVIATVFSILAGVLVAVISILGDPSMILDKSWRHGSLSIRENQRKLHRKNDIFLLYIALLAALFVFSITPKDGDFYWYVQQIVFFLTVYAFLVSLSLPYSLMAIQKERLEKTIDQMKLKSGGKVG